jgi:hypothetical protein
MKKNISFKYIVSALMVGLVLTWGILSQGAVVTSTPPAAQTNSLVTGPGRITQISLTATAGVAFVVSLYDAPGLSLTNYSAQYTNYVPTVYTNVFTYTDILGNTVSNSYYYITNIASVVGSAGYVTNTYRLIGTFAAPANTTVTVPYSTANPFIFGIFATNNVGGSMQLNYQPLK